jgi:hypothetical protein
MVETRPWPALPLAEWNDTLYNLHRWTQIVGKTALALSPMQNHWWQVTLHVTPRGLRTAPLPAQARGLEIEFDFQAPALVVRTDSGEPRVLVLEPMTVADFFARYQALLEEIGVVARFHPAPNEVEPAIPFAEDRTVIAYDAEAVRRCARILLDVDRVLRAFRSRFLGKCSPVHFWWGAFDMACTRFSGRTAPEHPGGFPHLPDRVTREAYSHECISAGWWPGNVGGPVTEPAFYAYVYPEPAGCPEVRVHPSAASWHLGLHEWVLPYDAVRLAPDPDAMVLEFLASTYDVAARLAAWPRAELERAGP